MPPLPYGLSKDQTMAKHNAYEFDDARINVRWNANSERRNANITKQTLRALAGSTIEYASNHAVNDSAFLYDNAE